MHFKEACALFECWNLLRRDVCQRESPVLTMLSLKKIELASFFTFVYVSRQIGKEHIREPQLEQCIQKSLHM